MMKQSVVAQPAGRARRRALLLGAVLLGLSLPDANAETARGMAPAHGYRRGHATPPVQVLRVSPADGTGDVPRATPLVVFFDRPMVALTALEAAPPAAPVSLDPAVPGRGRWLNTATWAWYPAGALHGATRYTLTVPAGLRAVDGAALAVAYRATFSTVRPAVARTVPADGATYTDFRAPVVVRFNQSMDRAAVAAGFALRDAVGLLVPGTLAWPRPDAVEFSPRGGLTPGARYSAVVGEGIRSAEGPLGAAGGAAWSFTTAGIPSVSRTTPVNGERAADMGNGLVLDLTAPVDPRLVRARLRVTPALPGLSVGVSADGLTANVFGQYAPSTHYHVALDGVVGTYGQALAAPLRLGFTTAPLPPAVQLSYGSGIVSFDAYRPVDVAVRAVNAPDLTLTLYPLARAEFLSVLQSGNLQQFTPGAAPLYMLRRTVSAPLNRTVSVGQELAAPGGESGSHGRLRPGFYFLRVAGSTATPDQMAFMVTRTALTLKTSTDRALVWATDLRSGRSLPRLPVSIVRGDTGGLLLGGHTGPDGVLDAPFAYPNANGSALVALLDRPGDVSLCSSAWGNGISPYTYNLPGSYGPSSRLGYLYTDRPIYRPGQLVHFRGLVRRDDDGAYGLPVRGTPVRVTLTDANGNLVYDKPAHLDGYGAFAGTATLGAAAALGVDTLGAQIGDQGFSVALQIAAYRKPDYTVAAAPTRRDGNYTTGTRVGVTVAARYLFGVPLNRARVHWSVVGGDLYFNAPAYPDYTFQDIPRFPFYGVALAGPGGVSRPPAQRPGYPAPAGGPYSSGPGPGYGGPGAAMCYGGCYGNAGPIPPLAQGDARTDAAGNLTLSMPADLRRFALSQQWSVEATVADINNVTVSGRTLVAVHKGLFYVGLRGPSALVVAGRPARLDLLTIAQDGATLLPRVPLIVRLYRRTYRTVDAPTPYGGVAPWWLPVDTLLRTYSAATGPAGQGSLAFTTPSDGEFRLVATARDARGNVVRSALTLYAAGPDAAGSPWANPPRDHVSVVPDLPLYRVGDVARVLVASPRPGMTALVTIERGRVYSHRVLRLVGASPILRIPILSRYLPDVFVSVVLVAGTGPHAGTPLWKMGVAELPVDVRARALRLTLRAGTGRAHPGDTLTVRLHAADAAGRPVRGQFSLGVADQGVLALAAEQAPAILDAFYAERGLGVQTAYSRNVAALQVPAGDKRLSRAGRERQLAASAAAAPLAGGRGGGGGAAGAGPAGAKPRAYFPDTAYWNPIVTTDANGDATVATPLPDSLTTWHIVARGLTADTLVGQAALDVVSTRDLLLRPLLPRFFTLGDGARVGAVVNNTTGHTLMARLTLWATGAALSHGQVGGQAAGQVGQVGQTITVAVGPTGERLVTWPLRPAGLGTLRLLLTAAAGDAVGDSVLVSAPVVPNSTPETVATAGEVGATRLEQVTVPAAAQPGEGALTLTVQPSLAAGLRSSVDFLRHYPFESNEDLAARIMGEVALARLPASATGLSAATLAAYRRDVATTITHLLGYQHGDGGWGWWFEDPYSSPAITAFCLDALGVARRAGYPVLGHAVIVAQGYVSTQARAAGAAPLASSIGPADVTPDLRAYMAYVLDANGGGGDAMALYAARDTLPLWSRAYLLRALYREAGGEAGHLGPRGHTILSELEAGAHLGAAGAHWESSGDDATMDDPIRATAVVLDALVEADPTSPLIAPATRWLMSVRGGDAWQTTVENAVALRTLSDELRGSGELRGRYRYAATLGGGTWGTGRVDASTLAAPRVLRAPVGPVLAPGSTTRVVLTRSNRSGRLYYTLRLSYYPRVDTVKPLAAGVAITRAYLYNGRPVVAAPAGAILRVRLTITATQDLYYAAVEDPLPAGAEAVDPTLLTTSALQAGGYTVPAGSSDLAWYVDHVELRDDRAALFAGYLPVGVYRYEYTIHLTTPGVFHALPAHVAETYFPEVFGHSAGGYLTVR